MTTKTPIDELQAAIRADLFRALEAIPPVECSIESMIRALEAIPPVECSIESVTAAVTRVLSEYLPAPDIQVQVEARNDREMDITISYPTERAMISGVADEDEKDES